MSIAMGTLLVAEDNTSPLKIVSNTISFMIIAFPPGVISFLNHTLNLLFARGASRSCASVHVRRFPILPASFTLLVLATTTLGGSIKTSWLSMVNLLTYSDLRGPVRQATISTPSVILLINASEQVFSTAPCNFVAVFPRTRDAEL